MEEQAFWNFIAQARQQSESTEDVPEVLAEILSKQSIEQIIEFDVVFSHFLRQSYQSRLWAAAYIVNGGCADDGFEYFRCWLIAQGKENYEKVLIDPEYLAELTDDFDLDCEPMLYVGSMAFEMKTGKDFDAYHDLREIKGHIAYPDITIDWNEDTVGALFPGLTAKFTEN